MQKERILKNIILITDPNEDTDDLVSLIFAAALVKMEKINLLGVVATVGDDQTRINRAKYAKGIFNYLKVKVPVCVGDDYNKNIAGRKVQDDIFVDSIYLKKILSKGKTICTNANQFLTNILNKSNDQSITIVNIAGLTDLSKLMQSDGKLFNKKVKEVFLMSNLILPKTSQYYLPDLMAHNNQIDIPNSNFVFEYLQKNNIVSYIVNSKNTKKVPISMKYYEDMKVNDCIVSKHAYEIQKEGLRRHYENILLGKAENKYTIEWFYKNFTSIKDSKQRTFDEVWKYINRLYLYDPLTLLTSIDDYRENYFSLEEYSNFKLCIPKNYEAIYRLFNELPKISMNF